MIVLLTFVQYVLTQDSRIFFYYTNREGGKRQAYYQPQVTTDKRRSLPLLVPLSLTTQVLDQRNFLLPPYFKGFVP